jgi:hypothetical protein
MNTTERIQNELRLIEERFANTLPFVAKVLGSKSKALRFQTEYLTSLRSSGATLFYNKFVAVGYKPRASYLRIVK